MQVYLLSVFAALFVFFIATIVFSVFAGDKNRLKQRLQMLSGNKEETARHSADEKRQKNRRMSVSKSFANELSSAGIRMRPEEFLFLWFAAAAVPGGMLYLFGAHIITILAVFLIGMLAPPFILKRSKKKRMRLFDKQLGDSLMLMGNCLRSGLTFQQGMVNISKEMPDPIGREFTRTIKEMQFGGSMESALNNMMQRIPSVDLMLMVSAVQIQREVGGNMLEILENISATVKERHKLREDIRTMTASGRISSVVVGMLPIVIGGVLMLINPSYIQTFFETTIGIGMIALAVIMEAIGFLLINKIVTIKY